MLGKKLRFSLEGDKFSLHKLKLSTAGFENQVSFIYFCFGSFEVFSLGNILLNKSPVGNPDLRETRNDLDLIEFCRFFEWDLKTKSVDHVDIKTYFGAQLFPFDPLDKKSQFRRSLQAELIGLKLLFLLRQRALW